LDVGMFLRALIAWDHGERHVWSVVRVPGVDEEDLRRSHRERDRLVRERTAHSRSGYRGDPPRASETARGSVERGTTVAAEEERDDHLLLTLERADGRRETVSARYVIGAGGARSTTRGILHGGDPGGVGSVIDRRRFSSGATLTQTPRGP